MTKTTGVSRRNFLKGASVAALATAGAAALAGCSAGTPAESGSTASAPVEGAAEGAVVNPSPCLIPFGR